jgi:hypothetical protein
MKEVPVLSDMQSIKADHICGDANFKDQNWRFVVTGGELTALYKYEQGNFSTRHNFAKQAKKVARLIAESALPQIREVFQKSERERAEREAIIKAQEAISDRIERIEKLGPKLLASLKELVFCVPYGFDCTALDKAKRLIKQAEEVKV